MSQPVVHPAPIARVSTATLIMGVPGAGKTSLAEAFAMYLWETYRKILLLYSWDGGAIPTGVQKRMKQNLIRFWRCRTRSAQGLALDSLYFATKGYWPRAINPLTGETAPAAPLVPPLTTQYLVSCPEGHMLQMLPRVDLVQPTLCSACKQLISRDKLRVVETVKRTRGFEDVGGVFYDGLTSMSGAVLEHMDQARGAGQIGGEKSSFGGVVTSGNITFGGNNRADVGFGQTRAQLFVTNSLSIPGLVEGPVFTALTKESTDEGGLSIVGVKLPGDAVTDEAAAWFGNVFEMGRFKDDAGHQHYALYLRQFYDAQQRRHLLKTSASPTGLPDVLIDPLPSEGAAFSVANLGNVFKLLDEDLRTSLLETVEGVPEAPSEYGESFGVAPGPATAPAAVPRQTVAAGPVGAVPHLAGVAAGPSAPMAPIASQYAPTGDLRVAPVVIPVVKPRPTTTMTPAPTPHQATTTGIAPPPGMKPPQKLE